MNTLNGTMDKGLIILDSQRPGVIHTLSDE